VTERLRVALLAGGRSSEHEISLASARSVLAALDPARYDVISVAIGRDGRWALDGGFAGQLPGSDPGTRSGGPGPAETLPVPAEGGTLAALGAVDVVLPILHGPFGEDGTVQGLLELAGIPYVGAGVAGSALAMDKDLFKKVMRDSGIPVARHHTIRLGDEIANPYDYPVFVKPARLGSSVGISKVHDESELAPAVELARRHDEKVLVEEFVSGMEVECGVLGNRVPPPVASLPGRIDTLDHEWYDYESKYAAGGMELVIPPELPQETIELVQQRAVDSFVAGDCEGLARVDFFVRDDGEVIVNELNTMPGFTDTSVYAKLFEASGVPYAELLDRLIGLALERAERRSKLEF
jgi:D-alanine-D-alanine ligase